ncbi:sodium-dependent bicarbonate transport family permease [Shewanella algae]|uniref:sodium-dependent bicarbonate transport family permease n=1 Tax=Shewanella algae TaxID=38313 RepID=UPI0011840149|nr:sodium-dependent bicarbonate transport family permease [Shewanella algae]MBO2550902.1 sodium-dependent bicarbonate transport family permease [Shewanella algae]MBO2602035.1 sodium-dependent bicarbonate transport family permease [Shewanella algae]MBO2660977.1 sodium-dependent bicarbonate transport family permease [Shewanella algae]MCL1053905.1 sodium-dependent bicarbonate transport family permease [Shewanella algae]TVL38961.1 sodium-dependent bicarbonate transport family permease [Shewanella 
MPDVVIAFFGLGLLAGLLKSDLRVPESTYETLSILLMLTLGLKGGMALHGHTDQLSFAELGLVIGLGLAIPLALYPILKKVVRLPQSDAISIAAHYGSVSAGTFAVVYAMTEQLGWPLKPETTLYLVLLELPSIIVMLWLYRRLNRDKPGRGGNILLEALTSRGVILLGGGVLIGWGYGAEGLASLSPVLMQGFKTLLALFLLEMGLCTARVCAPLPLSHWRLLAFAAVTPFVLAWVGIITGHALGLPAGSALVLAGLCASASYIAAPAAIRAAIPSANIGVAMLASLGVTFPINLLIGLNLYRQWVAWIYGL